MEAHDNSTVDSVLKVFESLNFHPMVAWAFVLILHTAGWVQGMIIAVTELPHAILSWSEGVSYWLASILSILTILKYVVKGVMWLKSKFKKQ